MKNINEIVLGLIGTSTSAVGTALQPSEVLQIISMIITILGGIISLIVLPLLSWYKNAKKDGKITAEEIEEGAKTLQEGLEHLNQNLNDNKKKGD